MWRRVSLLVGLFAASVAVGTVMKSRTGSATANPVRTNSRGAPNSSAVSDQNSFSLQQKPRTARGRPTIEQIQSAEPAQRLRLLVSWLPAGSPEELGEMANWIGVACDGGAVSPEWQVLVHRWVELDPGAAITFAREQTARLLRSWSSASGEPLITPLHYAYRALASVDADLALSFLAEEPRHVFRHLRDDVIGLVGDQKARAWAESLPERSDLDYLRVDPRRHVDPAKAAQELLAGKGPRLPFSLEFVASNWASKDPEAAIAWAHGLGNTSQREVALAAIAKSLLGNSGDPFAPAQATDLAKARQLLDAMPNHWQRAGAEIAYAAKVAETDPEAAVAIAKEKLDGVARLEALVGIAARVSRTDPLRALALLRGHAVIDFGDARLTETTINGPTSTMSQGRGPAEFGKVIEAAAAHDPSATMDYLSEAGSIRPLGTWGDPASQHAPGGLARTVFNEWAARDVRAAASWLGQQTFSAAHDLLVEKSVELWATSDAAGLKNFCRELAPGEMRETFVGKAAGLLAINDAEAALAWAAEVGGTKATEAAFTQLTSANPPAALEYFPNLTPSRRASHAQHLTDELARRVPAEAVQFYESLSPEQRDTIKLRDTVIGFAKEDPRAASEWIASLPRTAAKDSAISGLVDYLITEAAEPDLEAGAHWAAASIEAEERAWRLERVAQAWTRQSGSQAREEIANSDLPEDVKQILLRHAPKH